MSPERPDLMMGSDEGMFERGENLIDELELIRARAERHILPDVGERVAQTLSANGLEPVREIAPEIIYHTAEAWIDYRIYRDRGTKFYPFFATTQEGEDAFVKMQITDLPSHRQALEEEAAIVAGLPQGITPRLLADGREQDGLMYIALEAVPFSEGRVGRAEDWQETHAASAASEIHELEALDLAELAPELQALPQFRAGIDVQAVLEERLEQSAAVIPSETWQGVREGFADVRPKDVLAHRDTALKNIILKDSGEVVLVDWELAGRGFLGQDAGKIANELRANPEAYETFTTAYTQDNPDRRAGMYLGMIIEKLEHLAWRAGMIEDAGTEPSQAAKWREEIARLNQDMDEILKEYRGAR